MGIDHPSQGILTVDLPPEPEMGPELEIVAEVVRDGVDCDLVVDFSRADIVTSSSISKLLKLNKLLSDRGHRLVLCNAATATKGIFKVAGLDGVFEFTADESAAFASINNTQPVNK
ncbi:MAG: STAS domain-containing protein [Planctomycetota bacterium]